MATKRPGDDTNGHSGNGHAPDAKKTKDVSNITNIGVFPRNTPCYILIIEKVLTLNGCLFIPLIGAP